jgi:hypothetical protein
MYLILKVKNKVFKLIYLSYFSKEFYHLLAVSGNEAERSRLWGWLATKLVKEKEPEEIRKDFRK